MVTIGVLDNPLQNQKQLMGNWKEENNRLVAKFTFKDFSQAWAFMSEVAIAAEKQNHHPEWSNVYNNVTIHLSTHDAGNIVTEKDKSLSNKIDKIFFRYKV
jgi:4a-hydroxytetrahydrobiopterin dehydratase